MAVATDGSDFDFVRRMTPEGYVFPTHRLKQTCAPGKVPLIIVACGSFSPVTLLHLRMFPMALDHAKNTGFDVVGGYLSPVGDAYKKNGLARAHHRVNMCRLAAENTSKWLMVDTWEAENDLYMPTARVLDHFDWEINHVRGGVETTEGTRVPAKIMLLAGADLIQTISTPGVWDVRDVNHILGNFGVFVVERTGTDLETALGQLKRWEKNIHVIRQVVTNDISSTKVRLLLKRNMSIDYLIPQEVIEYIIANNLYHDMDLQATEEGKGKGKGKGKAVIPVLIAANKMDLFTALPASLVKSRLENELGRIRSSRSKGLLDSGVGVDEIGSEEHDSWLGEYASDKFSFQQMMEFDIDVEVIPGSVTTDAADVDRWWWWMANRV